MDWIIKIVGSLLITSFTGSMGMLIWWMSRKLWEKQGYGKISYVFLKGIVFLYLVPAVFMGMLAVNSFSGRWRGVLCWATETILKATYLIIAIWTVGAILISLRYLYEARKIHRQWKNRFACEGRIRKIFDEICRELGIRSGKVELSQSYEVQIPQMAGLIKPKVVIPAQEYTKEQLYTSLFHELTHYQNRDIWWKYAVMLVTILHFYNPFAWMLSKAMCRWSEYACDEKACEKVENIKTYFTVIVDVAEKACLENTCFSLRLSESKKELIRRIEYMKNVKMGKRSKKAAVALAAVSILLCTTAVFAGADMIGKQYTKWYMDTDVEKKLEMVIPYFEEYYEEGTDPDITIEEGEVDAIGKSLNSISWEVKGKTLKKTSSMKLSAGTTITVSVTMDPSDINVKAGIIDEEGNKQYVTGKKNIIKEFSVKKNGNYSVFVENQTSTTVTALGSYYI